MERRGEKWVVLRAWDMGDWLQEVRSSLQSDGMRSG